MDKQLFTRSAGILLPVSSLPSPYGIGSFGKAARDWVDFLSEAGQSFWQILPLVPTDKWNSPYSSPSAFAGNPFFIDLDTLWEEGLLKPSEYRNFEWGKSANRVDYNAVTAHRNDVLLKAWSRFKDDAAIDDFASRNPRAKDYALYITAKTAPENAPFHLFVQYQFMKQWQGLHAYARSKNVEIIGDIPIYVSLHSADVWANPELFQLDENLKPTEVAGCPPDRFAADGQLWGNPLYNWNAIRNTGYEWWIERLRHCFELYDVVRIDHFRGLESYFAIPSGDKTARNGKWKPGPGKGFINAVKDALPDARIIAEDLGYITKAVRELVTYSGYPSMKLLQFAFDARVKGKDYMPDAYRTNTVVYTGTHDNDTLKGWSKNAPGDSIKKAMRYFGIKRVSELPLAMICLTFACDSNLAIIPMQDWLGLGSSARINTPATAGKKNWSWRMEESAMSDRLAAKIYEMTSLHGRAGAVKG